MKIASLFPFALILLITACQKKEVGYSDDPFPQGFDFYGDPVVASCSPKMNTTIQDGDTIEYTAFGGYDPYYHEYADWGISARTEGWMSKNVHIDFAQEPISGKYVTTGLGSFLGSNQCIVGGLWYTGNMGLSFIADVNDTVYVNNLGFGKYDITFCDLHFTSTGSNTYEFSTSGNITID